MTRLTGNLNLGIPTKIQGGGEGLPSADSSLSRACKVARRGARPRCRLACIIDGFETSRRAALYISFCVCHPLEGIVSLGGCSLYKRVGRVGPGAVGRARGGAIARAGAGAGYLGDMASHGSSFRRSHRPLALATGLARGGCGDRARFCGDF